MAKRARVSEYTHAYCYASGQIEFGPSIPSGALPIARGPDKALRDFICGVARHGYRTEDRNGRPTKVPGSDCLLVPGIPEAPDQSAALDALANFTDWISQKPPKGVTTIHSKHRERTTA